jgi:hypothetical protein
MKIETEIKEKKDEWPYKLKVNKFIDDEEFTNNITTNTPKDEYPLEAHSPFKQLGDKAYNALVEGVLCVIITFVIVCIILLVM